MNTREGDRIKQKFNRTPELTRGKTMKNGMNSNLMKLAKISETKNY